MKQRNRIQRRNDGFGAIDLFDEPATEDNVTDNRGHDSELIGYNALAISPQDFNEGGVETDLKKIVVILIPLKRDRKWAQKFDGNTYGEMYFIVANDIYNAKNKFFKYLGSTDNKVQNVIFDTHGGGPGLLYIDNKNGSHTIGVNYINEKHLLNYKSFETGKSKEGVLKRNILSMKMILEQVENYGNAIFLGCTVAKDEPGKQLLIGLHGFNYMLNVYASQAYNIGTVGSDSVSPWYTYSGIYQPTIDWKGFANVTNPSGVGTTRHYNIKGKGFKLMTAKDGFLQDLAVVGKYDGILKIDGIYARFDY